MIQEEEWKRERFSLQGVNDRFLVSRRALMETIQIESQIGGFNIHFYGEMIEEELPTRDMNLWLRVLLRCSKPCLNRLHHSTTQKIIIKVIIHCVYSRYCGYMIRVRVNKNIEKRHRPSFLIPRVIKDKKAECNGKKCGYKMKEYLSNRKRRKKITKKGEFYMHNEEFSVGFKN